MWLCYLKGEIIMATRTTYTSTIKVPVYANWKCEECGSINFSEGIINFESSVTTKAFSEAKHNEAKLKAENQVKIRWMESAYRVINDPNKYGLALYNNSLFYNTKCSKCGKRPRWDKHPRFRSLLPILIVVALISGIGIVMEVTSITAWLCFLASAGVIVWQIIRESKYNEMMTNFPRQYTPVIGSLNPELNAYANAQGKHILNPMECAAAVAKHDNSNVSIN